MHFKETLQSEEIKMTNIRIFKYPENRIYIECKFDYDKDKYRYVKERGFKKRSGAWHYKVYYIEDNEVKKKYKADIQMLIKNVKYKRIEIFRLVKKISNVEKILEQLGVEL